MNTGALNLRPPQITHHAKIENATMLILSVPIDIDIKRRKDKESAVSVPAGKFSSAIITKTIIGR